MSPRCLGNMSSKPLGDTPGKLKQPAWVRVAGVSPVCNSLLLQNRDRNGALSNNYCHPPPSALYNCTTLSNSLNLICRKPNSALNRSRSASNALSCVSTPPR